MIRKLTQSKKIYLVFILILLVWVLFFDQSNLFQLYGLRKEKISLEKELEFYSEEIRQMKENRARLHSSEDLLEAFARETYRMKKDNEDIYVVEKSDN